MASLEELLRRFRRAWAPPGPALTRVSQPVDLEARLRAEVAPLLEAIAKIQRRADDERAKAAQDARRRIDEATRRANAAAQDAERRAPNARAQAAMETRRASDSEIASVVAAARAEARRIEAHAKERLPALVERVRACVLGGVE